MRTRRARVLVASLLPALVPLVAGQGCSGLRYTLTTQVAPDGEGTVIRAPEGSAYAAGTQVALTATPAGTWHFDHWEGDLTGSVSPLTITMDNRHRYTMSLPGTDSVHSIDWRADRVQFGSWDESGTALQTWTYTNAAAIPPSGGGNARINLWLLNGSAPSDGQNAEVIVKSFQFTPASP